MSSSQFVLIDLLIVLVFAGLAACLILRGGPAGARWIAGALLGLAALVTALPALLQAVNG